MLLYHTNLQNELDQRIVAMLNEKGISSEQAQYINLKMTSAHSLVKFCGKNQNGLPFIFTNENQTDMKYILYTSSLLSVSVTPISSHHHIQCIFSIFVHSFFFSTLHHTMCCRYGMVP